MKELSIEQKAKAYDNIIEKANKMYSENCEACQMCIEELIPELKESEDERIRKVLLGHFSRYQKEEVFLNNITMGDIVAWLEKQGEKHLENYDEAEKEKADFVGDGFIECHADFLDFKEGNTYWLEYIGNDTYIGRSDNILNKKFHITPSQLYRLFTQQHRPKENNANEETNAPTEYGKYVDECLNEASKHFFSEGEDKYSVADLFYAGVRCGKSWLEKQGEQKPAWSEEDEKQARQIERIVHDDGCTQKLQKQIADWFKSLKERVQPQDTAYYNPYKEVVESIAEMCTHYDKASHSGLRDFYDNVKVKCKDAKEYDSLYPQNTWKPSDEQMNALNYVVNLMASSERPTENDLYYNILKSLRQQLKKHYL